MLHRCQVGAPLQNTPGKNSFILGPHGSNGCLQDMNGWFFMVNIPWSYGPMGIETKFGFFWEQAILRHNMFFACPSYHLISYKCTQKNTNMSFSHFSCCFKFCWVLSCCSSQLPKKIPRVSYRPTHPTRSFAGLRPAFNAAVMMGTKKAAVLPPPTMELGNTRSSGGRSFGMGMIV